MEHFPGQITCWATKQASGNLRKLKTYQASQHYEIRINYKKNTAKKQTCGMLKNQYITEKIKEGIKK